MQTKSFMETYFDLSKLDGEKFLTAFKETFYVTAISMIFIIILGLLLGLLLFEFSKKEGKVANILYTVLSIISNIFRSIPFIILIILLIPFTRAILGTFLGAKAAIPALVISATPFYARLVEMAFREVDSGVLEASEAMGATKWQMIRKVLLPESLPALISGGTVTTITMIGFAAMAGAVGGGGLGQLAYYQGYMQDDLTTTLFATACILILVFLIQFIGDTLVKRIDKR
ncbi:methionine ABC transporter permease [Vagococcus xieshaowenii]|uniref:ABC transporter permease subunit n=1 Tax=Vagococcus xieshaowenii TaxID=2562451 RepID=A0AAJ5JMV2_9ENTE|nr:ABC transporter permease subunit [Vagococcus xieshaowenii]QCA28844.1 ABC transporter permease subunit [Vagococcus xieshaowenii]TFZ43449.1 ABC transporter permease subunit [Vagococcus xieshaowenii]